MSNNEAIAQAFVQQYYATFDTNRALLKPLYHENSQMMFEGQSFVGPDAITTKLTSLPFQTVQHVITTIDAQITVDSGIMVFVIGQLKTDNDPPHTFSQTFYLKQVGDSIFALNDIFRLNLHHG